MPAKQIVYNKLVRDKIPKKIAKNGGECKIRTLNDSAMPEALGNKLQEEVQEFLEADTPEKRLSEAADILIVIQARIRIDGLSVADLNKSIDSNVKAKGHFNKNVFLIWATEQ